MRKTRLLGALLGIALIAFISAASALGRAESEAIHAFEEGNHCEAISKLKWLYRFSDAAHLLLAQSYAGGLCIDQNIQKARELYRDRGEDDQKASWRLFYDALTIASFDDLSKKPRRSREIKALFLDGYRHGFRPSSRELSALTTDGLTQTYQEAVSSKE